MSADSQNIRACRERMVDGLSSQRRAEMASENAEAIAGPPALEDQTGLGWHSPHPRPPTGDFPTFARPSPRWGMTDCLASCVLLATQGVPMKKLVLATATAVVSSPPDAT